MGKDILSKFSTKNRKTGGRRKLKIKIKVNIQGFNLEFEDIESQKDPFAFLEELILFIEKRQGYFKIQSKEQPKLEIEPATREVGPSNETNDLGEESDRIQRLSKDAKIDSDKLKLIYDFDADSDIPPLLCKIEGDTRTQQQRNALYLILYSNNVLNQNKTVSSLILKNILEKVNIDPSDLSKSVASISGHIVIDGKSYRITLPGIIEARKILTEIATKIS